MEPISDVCNVIKAKQDLNGTGVENASNNTECRPQSQSEYIIQLYSEKKREIEHVLQDLAVLTNTPLR